MGLLDLIEFALKCVDVLAWPLFALVYPLYSSIRAIETNSITDTLKLNNYWVVFSLILLFEHAFMKLLEWFPFWQYIRLLIVFWLVIPHFDGAFYVYKHLICPCLSMDLQNVIARFNNRKESLMRGIFLSEVERYVKENGPEALEKLVTSKSTESNLDVKEFNAVSSMENKASISVKPNGGHKDTKAVYVMVKKKETTANQSISVKPNGGHKDIKAVYVIAKKKETTANQVSQVEPNLTGTEDGFSAMKINEKAIEVAADSETLETPLPKKVLIREWTCTVPIQTDTTFISPLGVEKHKAVNEALKLKNETEPKLTQTESSTVAAMETKEKPLARREYHESPKRVQKKWTCALCQVTTGSETDLNSHLQGRKHKEAYKALEARNWAFVRKMAPASTTKSADQPNKEPPSSGSKLEVNINENVRGQKNGIPAKLYKPKENVQVYKPKENVQEQQENPNKVARKDKPLRCEICDVYISEFDMVSHLNGSNHWDRC